MIPTTIDPKTADKFKQIADGFHRRTNTGRESIYAFPAKIEQFIDIIIEEASKEAHKGNYSYDFITDKQLFDPNILTDILIKYGFYASINAEDEGSHVRFPRITICWIPPYIVGISNILKEKLT